jgi:predicted PurR-regulated permease PerM
VKVKFAKSGTSQIIVNVSLVSPFVKRLEKYHFPSGVVVVVVVVVVVAVVVVVVVAVDE